MTRVRDGLDCDSGFIVKLLLLSPPLKVKVIHLFIGETIKEKKPNKNKRCRGYYEQRRTDI